MQTVLNCTLSIGQKQS